MTFLPIAARELAVAARRPATYRLRAFGVLSALFTVWIVARGNFSKAALGQEVLTALGVATLGFSMVAGLLLTANSIVAEKEAGTIGLLFLTDLKGYDIVLGKLVAHALNAFSGLLAIFPVMAFPLLLGSVTASEFSRMLLVFGTTLLFSASLGLVVSAMTTESNKALGLSILLMAAAAGIMPTLWWLQKINVNSARLDFLLWPSPAFAFRHSFDIWYRTRLGAVEFWHSLQTIWCLTVICLAWASFLTPRAWQQGLETHKTRGDPPKPQGWEKAEDQNPYYRVTIKNYALSSLANKLLAIGMPVWFCFLIASPTNIKTGPPVPFLVCLFLGTALHIVVKFLMIVESASRLNHDRNSGALELLYHF